METSFWDRKTFYGQLKRVGEAAYHDKHPFNRLMHQGRLQPLQLRRWILNRFYYQSCIPMKDAAILSNCPLRDVRRILFHRVTDHDGQQGKEGGLEAWLRLREAAGLERQVLLGHEQVLPAVRFAVDAYLQFARSQPWPVAIASSLTELFAPDLMRRRLEAFEKHYPWIETQGLDYFRGRLTRAKEDSEEALEITLTYCQSRAEQLAAVKALVFKCDILWALLDAVQNAYGPVPQAESTKTLEAFVGLPS